jgi:hypothetical protein
LRQSKPQACPSDFGCATDPVAMATFVSRAGTTTVAKSRVTVRRPRSPRPSGRVRPAHDPLATGLDRHAGADIKYVRQVLNLRPLIARRRCRLRRRGELFSGRHLRWELAFRRPLSVRCLAPTARSNRPCATTTSTPSVFPGSRCRGFGIAKIRRKRQSQLQQ